MRPAWVIAKKELKLLFKSTRRIFLLFMMPIIIFSIGGVAAFLGIFLFPSTIDQPIEVIIIQDDAGVNNTNWGNNFYLLLKTLNATKNFEYYNETIGNFETLREGGEYDILVYIPGNFSQLINQTSNAEFYVYYDASEIANEGAIIEIMTASAIFNQQLIFLDYGGPINLQRVSSSPVNISKGSGALLASTLSIIPMYLIFFLVIPPITLVLISVTIEREQKTLESVLLQPIDRKQFIGGKILYGILIIAINTVLTVGSILALIIAFFVLIPENMKQQINPIVDEIIKSLLASESEFWIFILYILIGLVIISLLLVTVSVFFSMMARDEREANMVISSIIMLPLVSVLFLVYLPLGQLPEIILALIGILPAIGFLFSIYLIILKGEITFIVWISLLFQIVWIGLIVWLAGRLIESEGILQISFKKLLKFWKK